MAQVKSLSAKQLAVIDDLFESKLSEQEILENHGISKRLYNSRWLVDESFNHQLDRRTEWEYRRNEIILARCVREAMSNLMELTKSTQAETARKACIDIITMRANLVVGSRSSNAPVTSVDNSASSIEFPNLSAETAGKILAILADEKRNSTS